MMRRLREVVAFGALAAALFPSAALAAFPAAAAPRSDFQIALGLRLFGEITDSVANFSAASGDAVSESPLRNLALAPALPRAGSRAAIAIADAPSFVATLLPGARPSVAVQLPRMSENLSPGFATSQRQTALVQTPAAPPVDAGAYSPIYPAAPAQGADATASATFGAPSRPQQSASLGTSLTLGSPARSTEVPVAVKVGPVAFSGHVDNASSQLPTLALSDDAYGAGADFDVRAGRRTLNFGVGSSYEHLARDDQNNFSAATFDPDSAWELPGAGASLVIPNHTDVNKFSLGAGVAVPVVNGLTLNLQVDSQRLLGIYGLTGPGTLDASGNSYGGRLIFAMPHSSSTLSISAGQYRYQDNVLPANIYTQTRGDVNYTVKF